MKIWLMPLSVMTVMSPKLAYAQVPAPAPAALRCELIMLTQDIFRGLKPDYVAENLSEKNTNRLIEVPFQAPIQNQGNRGFCHMYSLYEEFVREYKARNNGKDPQISIYYWAYFHWLGRAVETAKNVKAGLEVPEGNWYEGTFDLIKKYGVMTQEQWARMGGHTDIEVAQRNFLELGQLKTVMQKSHIEKNLLMSFLVPKTEAHKTKGDYYTALLMDPTVAQQLKSFVAAKSDLLKRNQTAFTPRQLQILKDLSKGLLHDRKLSDNEVQSFIYALNKDIENSVTQEFTSIFFGQTSSPMGDVDIQEQRALAAKMFPEVGQKSVSFATTGARQGPVEYDGHQGDHVFFKAPLPKMVEIIKQQIDKGNSVWIGYDHDSYFVDNKTGAMTIEGMASLPMNPHITRADRNQVDLYYGGHATQIVGYEVNDAGEIVAFKMQNSWGTDVGRGGFYRMDMSYFRSYIWRVTVRDENHEFTPAVIAQLEKLRAAKGNP